MNIKNYKEINKGAVIAKFDLEFEEWGLTIRECLLLHGSKGYWVSYPSRQYEKDGEKKYFDFVVFTKYMKNKLNVDILEKLKNELNY